MRNVVETIATDSARRLHETSEELRVLTNQYGGNFGVQSEKVRTLYEGDFKKLRGFAVSNGSLDEIDYLVESFKRFEISFANSISRLEMRTSCTPQELAEEIFYIASTDQEEHTPLFHSTFGILIYDWATSGSKEMFGAIPDRRCESLMCLMYNCGKHCAFLTKAVRIETNLKICFARGDGDVQEFVAELVRYRRDYNLKTFFAKHADSLGLSCDWVQNFFVKFDALIAEERADALCLPRPTINDSNTQLVASKQLGPVIPSKHNS